MSETVYNLIVNRRSIRRFQKKNIDSGFLKKLVNVARLAPSVANLQPLEFIIVNDKELCLKIFEIIGWAGYLKDWTPSTEEKPDAFIIILVKATTNTLYMRDVGLASENIIITAENEGIGSCILLNFKEDMIKEILKIPDGIKVDSVIALGYKAEHPIVEDKKDSVEYWIDRNQVLHVPKRRLEDILHINKF